MSASCRSEAAKLKKKYAEIFDVPIAKVVVFEYGDDSADIYVLPTSREGLRSDELSYPIWHTGVLK